MSVHALQMMVSDGCIETMVLRQLYRDNYVKNLDKLDRARARGSCCAVPDLRFSSIQFF